jgi:hypothetical protein
MARPGWPRLLQYGIRVFSGKSCPDLGGRGCYNPNWPNMPNKLPLDIPQFEGKVGEDPSNHIISFHLWCSSNSIIKYSIRLRLF